MSYKIRNHSEPKLGDPLFFLFIHDLFLLLGCFAILTKRPQIRHCKNQVGDNLQKQNLTLNGMSHRKDIPADKTEKNISRQIFPVLIPGGLETQAFIPVLLRLAGKTFQPITIDDP
jgi:hypothetical protein